MSASSKKHSKKRPFYRRRWFITTIAAIIWVIVVIFIAFRVSPWPGALVIKTVFNRNGHQKLVAMQQALPDYPVTVLYNQAYRPHDKTALLDVYIPQSVPANKVLPVVIWTHGGAWLSGDKRDDGPYFSRLADQGFVVVSLNYALAPGKQYPYAVQQLNDAHAYITAHATEWHGDARQLFLAGDSAGAQLSSQLAAMITDPGYAREVGIQPSLQPDQMAGVVLFCGIYKVEGLTQPNPALPKIIGWGDDVTVWAYSGSRGHDNANVKQMSTYYHVTKDYPATFISGGNGDPLTNAQSIPFADELSSLGVPVARLFYAKDHTPSLPHEYQFTFDADGEKAFTQTVQFLRDRTSTRL